VKAVAFTGSMAGGRALMDAAAARPDPIPVYAEMGSLNPVFVMPSALSDESWAATVAASVTGSAGQLCTKPGLVVAPDTVDGHAFADRVAGLVAGAGPVERMLTPGMAAAHREWLSRASRNETVVVAPGEEDTIRPFAVTTTTLDADLLEEHFGPTTVLCLAPVEQYVALADRVPGSLAGAILCGESDEEDAVIPAVVAVLARRVGRIIFNGVPTGVAVTDAMHHGGPWPAASNSRYTSVGTHAVDRFVRPVALQGMTSAIAPYIN
jgi:acyl-CoA reductase-like NAD-dependent aldehyde dehydrogenase